jgi:hypothetical protein
MIASLYQLSAAHDHYFRSPSTATIIVYTDGAVRLKGLNSRSQQPNFNPVSICKPSCSKKCTRWFVAIVAVSLSFKRVELRRATIQNDP